MARRDLSGNSYQLTAERAAIEAVARRYRIPFWQAEMALATDPGLMRGIINDAVQRSQAGPGPMSPTANPAGAAQVQTAPQGPVGGGSGWQAFRPLTNPMPTLSSGDRAMAALTGTEPKPKAKVEEKKE